jgi:hypothetical protein
MKRIKRRKRQLLSKLKLLLVEWLDPQEPQTYLGMRAVSGTPRVYLPGGGGPHLYLFQES